MSGDRKYRYTLERWWGPGAWVLWAMLNPSAADDQREDPTLHRCIHFARSWGYGGLVVVNLASFVSSHPDDLFVEPNPIGGNNDKLIAETARKVVAAGGLLVAAWGCSMRFDDLGPPALLGRDAAMLKLLTEAGNVHCLGFNANGSPKHPGARGTSRPPNDAQPIQYAALGWIRGPDGKPCPPPAP